MTVLKDRPDDAKALVLKGRLSLQQGWVEQGLAELQHAVRADPTSVPAHYYLATAMLQAKQLDLGEAELQSALELQSDFAPARTLLAGIEMDSGRWGAALSDLDTVVASSPSSIDLYVARSLVMMQQGASDQAQKELLSLLNQFPGQAEQAITYRALVWVMINQGRYDDARKYLSKASAAAPQSRETFFLSALAYLKQQQFPAALSYMKGELQRNPKWADGFEVAGEIASLAEEHDQAKAFFQEAVTLDPDMLSGWEGLAQALGGEEKYDAALDVLHRLVQKEPNVSTVYMLIARTEEKRRQWEKAQAAYRRLLELEPGNFIAKNNLAWNYSEHGGNIDLALRLAQEANQESPENPEICDTLGWIYIQKNILGDAILILQKGVALEPSEPSYKFHLAIAYLHAGQHEKAKGLLQTILRMQPPSPPSPLAEDAKKLLASIAN